MVLGLFSLLWLFAEAPAKIEPIPVDGLIEVMQRASETLEIQHDHETDFGMIGKTARLGVLDFRAFLNIAMLMTESERAGLLRKAILDIVIDTINRRTGGGTKYINQRDEDFIQSAFIEENYRKLFTDALKDCLDMGNFKYALYTDRIYFAKTPLAGVVQREQFEVMGTCRINLHFETAL